MAFSKEQIDELKANLAVARKRELPFGLCLPACPLDLKLGGAPGALLKWPCGEAPARHCSPVHPIRLPEL